MLLPPRSRNNIPEFLAIVGMNYTCEPLSMAVPRATSAEFMRLPKPKQRDPIFGLSRTFLNTLVIPCLENGYRPPVRSVVLRRRGAKTGVRLVDIESLRSYLNMNVEPTYQPAPEKNSGPAPAGLEENPPK
jgi:hypothetical protein